MATCADAFPGAESFAHTSRQLLAGLLNLGRHTVTGVLTTAGWQQRD